MTLRGRILAICFVVFGLLGGAGLLIVEGHRAIERRLADLTERSTERAADDLIAASQEVGRKVRRTNLLAGGLGLAAVLVGAYGGRVVYRSVVLPVGRLTEAARRIGAGDLSGRQKIEAVEELRVLADAFDRMGRQLSETVLTKGHLDNVLDSMAGALFLVSVEHTIERVNRATEQLLGYEPDELLGRPFDSLCRRGDAPGASVMVRLAVEGHLRGVELSLIQRDGSERPVSFSGSALRDAGGKIAGYVCIVHDLSGQKQVEQTIRESLKRKETLLREVHHRVKNNLQVILSLLDLQSRRFDDEKVREIFAESHNRIRAMALIHEQLYRAPNVDEIDICDYIETLARQVFESHGLRADEISIRFDLEQHPLEPERAVTLGLVVNELVANALKHGFSAGDGGDIEVAFRALDGDLLCLSVSDDGRGLATVPTLADPPSLGLKLVTSLARQLKGELRLSSEERTEFRVEFPARVSMTHR